MWLESVMLAHQVDRSWQSDLVARHPHLFVSGDHQTGISGYPLVGDGWRDLVERAVGRIADVIAAAPSARVNLVELKEKYATLRMYWSGAGLTKAAENAIADAVALAEARSACTCETCGAAGRLYRVGHQLLIACDEHGSGGAPVPIDPGWENIHLTRGTRCGKTTTLVCVRYIRETDSFVEVNPASLGIEE
jgi:hypothetical protein